MNNEISEQLQADFNNPELGKPDKVHRSLFTIEALPGQNNVDPILVFTCPKTFDICKHLSKDFMEELRQISKLANSTNI